MNPIADRYPRYGQLAGPVVMIGFGSIGRGTLPLILRHFDVDPADIVVVAPDTGNDGLLSQLGIRKVTAPITAGNYRDLLTPLLPPRGSGQGFCVNLSVDTSSVDDHAAVPRARRALHRHGRRAVAGLLLRRGRAQRHADQPCAASSVMAERRRQPGRHRPPCRAAARTRGWCRGSSRQALVNLAAISGCPCRAGRDRRRLGGVHAPLGVHGHPHRRARHAAAAHPQADRRRSGTPGRSTGSSPRGCSRPSSAGARTSAGCPTTPAPFDDPAAPRDLPGATRRRDPGAHLVPVARRAVRVPRDPQRVAVDPRLLHGA